MRKLLTCSTALSVALSSFSTLPARAQTLAEDGSVLGPDGAVLCTPTPEAPCDLAKIAEDLAARAAEAEAAAAAQAEAEAAAQAAAEEAARAQAEAEAAAQAAAEAAAAAEAEAKAAAEAEAAAQAQAAAEEAARAEAEARAQAEAEAAAQAAAEEATRVQAEAEAAAQAAAEEAARAQAQAEAEAAAQAEAEAAAQAAAEAAARAEAEAQAAAEAAVAAQEAEAAAEAAPEAVAEPVAEPVPEVAAEPAPEAVAEPAPEVAVEPAPEPAPEVVAEPAPEPAPAPAPEPAPEAVPEATVEAVPEPAPDPAPEVATAPEPAAEAAPEPVAAPVDVPVVPEEAAESLGQILALPSSEAGAESAVGEDAAEAAAAPVAAAAAAAAGAGTEPAAEAAAPVSVASEVISEDAARSSDEEFEAAPVTAKDGKKKDKLSDLEKVGLLALGALVVGAVINEGKKDEKKVVEATGDRVIVENPDGSYTIYKDDDAVLREPGVRTVTETYRDGSTRTVVQRADGTQVVTVRDASGRVLRRSVFDRYGVETVLIDDLAPEEPIVISELPAPAADRVTISTADADAALKAELAAIEAESLGRKFSLRQIRDIRQVRALAATVEVDSITFDTGSSVIRATEARKLADLGRLMAELLVQNPGHVFLIEGHTDAVGSAASNLLLSDRRAESLAKALTEYFDVPPENLVVQGYGEAELKIDTQGDERANRRVVVRLITPLMRTADLR